MSSVVGGIYTYLNAETDVTNGLSTYDFGNGDAPAIFTTDEIQEDAATPFIRISTVGGFRDGTDRTSRGGVVLVNVVLWGAKNDSGKILRELADTIWFALDRAPIEVGGYDVPYCLADPPNRLNDRDGFPGYVVSCRVLVRKE